MGHVLEVGVSYKLNSKRTRLRCLFFLAIAFCVSYLILSVSNISEIVLTHKHIFLSWTELGNERNFSITGERFTIHNEGCSIPFLKPFDGSIKAFVKYPQTKEACPNATLSLLANNLTHVWIQKENKIYHNITEKDNFTCCYQPFFRPVSINDITSSGNDNRVKYGDCNQFDEVIQISNEFVRVMCKVDKKILYQQYFLFAPKKQFVSQKETPISNNKSTFNVIVMGIDAVSRLNFHRTMPKTLAFLKDRGAIELLGYNKVGDNTFPNVVPMLMGISEHELKKTCTPNQKSTFDNCPLIWEWFEDAGYFTAFGEDSSSLGTFNYIKPGFLGSPTDYYIHTFIHEAETNVGRNKDFNSYLCMNDKYFYEVLLDYIKNLSVTLNLNRLFGFFWEVTMSHDYLNYPMLMDDKYQTFFMSLEKSRFLNDTIFLLVSDHGIRWGQIRSTKQGRLEERLPFVYVLLPPRFREKYSKAYTNIKLNSKRLTTPYDLHATLVDLVDINNIENNVIQSREKQPFASDRGISLFLPISTNRTCPMAHIADHWCSCHRSRSVSTDSIEAIEVAGQLVSKLNVLISKYRQCAQLRLNQILDINEMEVGTPDKNEEGWREYMVVIQTTPGEAIFEATLRRDKREWALQGTVSRLNLYGKQSRCMHNYQLKLYCYCY